MWAAFLHSTSLNFMYWCCENLSFLTLWFTWVKNTISPEEMLLEDTNCGNAGAIPSIWSFMNGCYAFTFFIFLPLEARGTMVMTCINVNRKLNRCGCRTKSRPRRAYVAERTWCHCRARKRILLQRARSGSWWYVKRALSMCFNMLMAWRPCPRVHINFFCRQEKG